MAISSGDLRPGFNHNDFYHRLLLRQVPPGCRRALDVGCGTGLFARRLARRAGAVEAIDQSSHVIAVARRHGRGVSNLVFTEADFAGYDGSGYGFISCLASLHHMPFIDSIAKLRDMLAPGGVLAVLGLYRHSGVDYLVDLAAVPANLAANSAVRVFAGLRLPTSHVNTAPVKDPDMTLKQIKDEAARIVPGVVVRRRLFWRYTLIYRRPSG